MNKASKGLLKLPQTFYKTLIDFRYYKVLDKLRVSKAIIYLVLISFLFSIIAVIPAALSIRASMNEFIDIYRDNAPEFTIEDGSMVLKETAPVYMIDDAGKAFVVVFDDTDTLTEADFREYQSVLLMDSDSVFLRSPMGNQDILYTLVFPNGTNKEAFLAYMGLIRLTNVIFIVLYIVLFVLFNLLGAFFITSIGNLILSFNKFSMKFSRAFALACYASTLPVLLKTIVHVFSLNIRFFEVIYVLVGVLYFWNAAKIIMKAEKEKSPVSE